MANSIIALTSGLFIILSVLAATGLTELFLSNLTPDCMRCLCHAATGCDLSRGCEESYCGPFRMSRLYWIDGDKVTLPYDDPERNHAFDDCAINYTCASQVVVNYIQRYGRDCNGDGVTDCEDYAMINGNGGVQCHHPLNRSMRGQQYIGRFNVCFNRG